MCEKTNFPVDVAGVGVPTKMWVNEWELDGATMQQIRNLSHLPGVVGVRIMPDAHLGKGACIGSVIAGHSVSPNAVGVDIGCLDAETEFLSPSGWVRMDEWSNHEVLAYDFDTDTARFEAPSRYVVKNCAEFYHFKNSKGMNQMLSVDHRVPVWKGFRGRGYNFEVLTPVELAGRSLENGFYSTKASFLCGETGVDLSDELIRVEVMVQADGRVRTRGDQHYVELHFRRAHKIERARKLLVAAELSFEESTWSDGSTCIRFNLPLVLGTKSFAGLWRANLEQLKVVADEVLRWDGHEGYCSFYSSTDKASADFIQYAFAATGIRASISMIALQKSHHDPVFYVVPTKNPMVGFCDPVKVESPDGRMYCFTVSTGFFIARRGGHLFITGNCGVRAVQTSLTLNDLPDDLLALRLAVEAVMPVGFNMHDEALNPARMQLPVVNGRSYDQFWADFANLNAPVSDRFDRAARQLGTMGGGNHFWELCSDEDGSIWLTEHSGSRNIGKEIAEAHVAVAKTLAHNVDLPDAALAVLMEGSPELDRYLFDLRWAQEYALRNRDLMMALSKTVMERFFPGITYRNEVNAHHNYVDTITTEDGLSLLVTRKGAIDASAGKLSLIPGSMGTGSFVVRGLGNEDSYFSASHGAGRKMSRGEAKRRFTVEDLAVQTRGVECRKDSGVVDEIPGAYKNIESVIEAQVALVEPVARLTTLLCIKG